MEKASLRASLSLRATKGDPARRNLNLYQHNMRVFGFRRALCTGERKRIESDSENGQREKKGGSIFRMEDI